MLNAVLQWIGDNAFETVWAIMVAGLACLFLANILKHREQRRAYWERERRRREFWGWS